MAEPLKDVVGNSTSAMIANTSGKGPLTIALSPKGKIARAVEHGGSHIT